jgi:hypothetical protein
VGKDVVETSLQRTLSKYSRLTRFYPPQQLELNDITSSSGRFARMVKPSTTHWRGRRLGGLQSRSVSDREEINATE